MIGQEHKQSREALEALQNERLNHILRWVYERSRFYREKFSRASVLPEDIKSINELGNLPFTNKEELHGTSPYDFLTMPLSGIVRVNMHGAERGFIKMYTAGDVAHDISFCATSLLATGINQSSVVGLLGDIRDSKLIDIQYALEGIGAAVIPLNIDNEDFLKLFDTIGMDTIVGSPKKIIKMIIQLQANGKDLQEMLLQRVVCLNDSLHNPLKTHIRQRINTEVYNIYVSAELGFNGIIYQCQEYLGQHLREDCFLPEIVAFGSDEIVTDVSRMGELVLTTLSAQAMPVIRYRTGQAVMRVKDKCSCGSEFLRIMTPLGE